MLTRVRTLMVLAAAVHANAFSVAYAGSTICSHDSPGFADYWSCSVGCIDEHDAADEACWNAYYPPRPSSVSPAQVAATGACILAWIPAPPAAAVAGCAGVAGAWIQDIVDAWGNREGYLMCLTVANSHYFGCATDCNTNHCGEGEGPGEQEQNWPGDNCPDCGPSSPIVLDLGPPGVRLTTPRAGVDFDINGDGLLRRLSWIAPGTEDGWLGLDRNGNGCIDSGLELFGNHTVQPESHDPNGYLALAVFDRSDWAGNGDGMISSQDAIFDELVVWVDRSHDGVCVPSELRTLREVGISAIGLNYTKVPLVDEHGNGFFMAGTVLHHSGALRASIDVFLSELETTDEVVPGHRRAPRSYLYEPGAIAPDSKGSAP